MNRPLCFVATAALFLSPLLFAETAWTDLLNGNNTSAWRSARSDSFPTRGWELKDGILTIHKSDGEESRGGGDIITKQRYSNFELELEFRLAPGGNSGIKFFVQPNLSPIDRTTGKPTAVGSAIGLEFQILDDDRHPDAKRGKEGNRTIGSLYDLVAAAPTKIVKPTGEWNQARIIASGSKVEFWLNGAKTLEFNRHSPSFQGLVAQSKYSNIPKFGEWEDGHILLQDHGDEVSFRNIRIRSSVSQ